jgi:transcription initiation factor IIE alpha subunit
LIVKSCTEDKQGILLLNPELGNYEFICHYKLDFKAMECLDYFCPVCDSNLTATDVKRNLARIIMIDEDQKEYDLYLSRHSEEQSSLIKRDRAL